MFLIILAWLGGWLYDDQNYNPARRVDFFTLVVLPDIQHYSSGQPQKLLDQTEWILANKDSLNIAFTIQVGDLVNNGGVIAQWNNADTCLGDVLDGKCRYLVVPGNHDTDDGNCVNEPMELDNYNTYFPYTRFNIHSWWGGSYPSNKNNNSYGFFSYKQQQYVVLGLNFCPSNVELNWADSIINLYSESKIILFTHAYMNFDDTRLDSLDPLTCNVYGCCGNCNNGEVMWDSLVSQHDNIIMVLSGHVYDLVGGTDGWGRRTDNVNGHPIHQVLQNWQHVAGGNGWLRYYTFKTDSIYAKSYSPTLDSFSVDPEHQFSLEWEGF